MPEEPPTITEGEPQNPQDPPDTETTTQIPDFILTETVPPSITCRFCHRTSFQPKDIRTRYCTNCKRYLDPTFKEDGPHGPDLRIIPPDLPDANKGGQ
jgi:hypothetical protein